MAEKLTELDELAFRIFSQRAASVPAGRTGQKKALAAFESAKTFIEVRGKIDRGELTTEKPSGPVLADCSAPNLPKTHPFNLVSQRFGDLARVARIKKFLDANPPTDDEPEKVVAAINREFPDLNWNLPALNIARAVFPAYCAA